MPGRLGEEGGQVVGVGSPVSSVLLHPASCGLPLCLLLLRIHVTPVLLYGPCVCRICSSQGRLRQVLAALLPGGIACGLYQHSSLKPGVCCCLSMEVSFGCNHRRCSRHVAVPALLQLGLQTCCFRLLCLSAWFTCGLVVACLPTECTCLRPALPLLHGLCNLGCRLGLHGHSCLPCAHRLLKVLLLLLKLAHKCFGLGFISCCLLGLQAWACGGCWLL